MIVSEQPEMITPVPVSPKATIPALSFVILITA
jgi:hypothetical protein